MPYMSGFRFLNVESGVKSVESLSSLNLSLLTLRYISNRNMQKNKPVENEKIRKRNNRDEDCL